MSQQPERTLSKGHTRNKSSVTRRKLPFHPVPRVALREQRVASRGEAENDSRTDCLAATRPRSSTKGPLDTPDDPLAPTPTTAGAQSAQLSPGAPQPSRRNLTSPRPRSSAASPVPQVGEARPKDFSFLQRPDIYHPLNPLNIPVAFRNSPKQPEPDTPLDELLHKGHFRAAAIAAANELTGAGSGPPVGSEDADRIFALLYTRLACLTLIDATPLAAQEVKALEDLSNVRVYVDEATGEHLVPWDLRVLIVRLQALSFGDPRRAVMNYHEFAREARANIAKATARHDNSSSELWKARLQDLGIKVAGALIDMEDLSGAAHHLGGLRDRGDGKMAYSKALLWLQLGDVEGARACAQDCAANNSTAEKIVLALCDMADAEYAPALDKWMELKETAQDEMIGVNAAVCLLYLGRMQEGRGVLESLVDSGLSSHTLLFNLSTVYELCTERNRNLKLRLAERAAGISESAAGWEKTNTDFKL